MSNKMSSLGWKCWTKTDLSFIDFATVLNNFLIEEPKKSKGPLLLYFSGKTYYYCIFFVLIS